MVMQMHWDTWKSGHILKWIHIVKSGKYEIVKDILKLDFFTDTELKSMIQYLSENNMIEAMAHVMEYVKNGNFKTDFYL